MSTAPKTWTKVDAFGKETGQRNVIHLFFQLRPDQTRGLPFLAPVIEPLKMLGTYTEAELMAAVVSGMYTVFIKTEGAESDTPATDKNNKSDISLDYGAIVDLGINESIENANPGRPNDSFDPFVASIIRQIGVALGIPYEVLIMHFTASYSASKAALLEAWRFFKRRRRWIAQNFCQVVYELWLAEAIARGRIIAPGYFNNYRIRDAYNNAQWVGDSQGQLDPTREMKAIREKIELGVSTVERETMELTGEDLEDNMPQIEKEREFFRRVGMPLSNQGDPVATPAKGDDD
jgi:lambda family phage portal protein